MTEIRKKDLSLSMLQYISDFNSAMPFSVEAENFIRGYCLKGLLNIIQIQKFLSSFFLSKEIL